VIALSRAPHKDAAGVRWLAGDLRDTAQQHAILKTARATHLVHLAWYVEHGLFWTAPENAEWIGASRALLAAFRESGGPRALCIGSCAEYDWARSDPAPWKESDPCRPATPYGIAKHTLYEQAMADAAGNGLSLVWARLFLMFGEGENPGRLVPAMIDALLHRQPLDLGSGSRVRDLMAMPDLAQALAMLLESELTGAANVASGSGIALAALGERLAILTGAPASLLRFGARADSAEPPHMVANVARLRAAGFSGPRPLADRLAKYVALRREK
jgi:nucleoside-diphosphate-sugar epimerase